MVRLARVFAWGELVGAVLWDDKSGTAAFEYSPSFVKKGIEICPLKMPLAAGRTYSFPGLGKETFMGLPGMLADCLPDTYGRALLDRWLASQGRVNANPVERLCYQGRRSMGALEFMPMTAGELDGSSIIEIDSLVKVAADILGEKESLSCNIDRDTKGAVLDIIRVGTSAGGQRAKAVIAYNDKTGEVRSGQADAPAGFLHYLIKLDGVEGLNLGDPKHYGRIEYAYHLMAVEAGVKMTECRLVEESGRAHFMTRRFDRPAAGGKLHMMTLCAMAHMDYRSPRAYSYEEAFLTMRRLRLGGQDKEQMFRRMVFNVMAMNHDDHTKNISFVMSPGGSWRLSPAYDMTWAYKPGGAWTSAHQMSVNGKWDAIGLSDLLAVADRQNIARAKEIVGQTAEALSHWRKYARECGVPKETAERIGGVIDRKAREITAVLPSQGQKTGGLKI